MNYDESYNEHLNEWYGRRHRPSFPKLFSGNFQIFQDFLIKTIVLPSATEVSVGLYKTSMMELLFSFAIYYF